MIDAKISSMLVVPEGKMAAPNDYRLVKQRLILPSGVVSILDVVKQTQENNCSEYTAIDSMLLLNAAGFNVARMGPLNIDNIEPKLITLINDGLAVTRGLTIRKEDYECLIQKIDDPYVTLTGNDTAILFRMMTTPQKELDFAGDIFLSPNQCLEKISSQQNSAMLIGSGNHATSIVKIGASLYEVDPYLSTSPITKFASSDLLGKISRKLSYPGSFAVVNQL